MEIFETSYVTMYPRIFSDIPYSREIFDLFVSKNKRHIPLDFKKPFLAPELEYRFKVINSLIKVNKGEVIVELGSGFSPRGLFYSKLGIDFLEVDLSLITNLKSEIIKNTIFNNCKTRNLTIISGNILKDDTWKYIYNHINGRKVTFVNEGLLRYMNMKEKTYISSKISDIIKQYGGKWITADVTIKNLIDFQKKEIFKENSDIKNTITILSPNNTFSHVEDAIKFFKQTTNLKVKVHHPLNIILASQNLLGLTNEDATNITRNVFILEIK